VRGRLSALSDRSRPLPLSLHEASIAVMIPKLRMLSTLLEKAVAHAEAEKIDPATLIEARLAPDMYPLSGQIQSASDAAKGCAARLSGQTPPSYPDTEKTFPELQERLAKTIAYLESVGPDQIDGREDATITIPSRNGDRTFTGRAYVLGLALPNFYFHVATTYDVLRHQGVQIGKRDYLAVS
jgi:hypothetical protein